MNFRQTGKPPYLVSDDADAAYTIHKAIAVGERVHYIAMWRNKPITWLIPTSKEARRICDQHANGTLPAHLNGKPWPQPKSPEQAAFDGLFEAAA